MVRYKVEMSKPGCPAEKLVGPNQLSTPVTLRIGSKATEYQLPMQHLATIEYFDKAFNGSFKEAGAKIMDLPEEHLAAFELFVIWLYRGIDDPMSSQDVVTWTRFLLMVDKWNLSALAKEAAKHIWNLLHEQLCPSRKGVKPTCKGLFDGHRIIGTHAFRFIFVHFAHVMSLMLAPLDHLQQLSDGTRFFEDATRWNVVLLLVSRGIGSVYRPSDCSNKTVQATHDYDKILTPMLFGDEAFPDLFPHLSTIVPDVNKRRQYLRDLVQI